MVTWACGVTTVPSRWLSLPTTLDSIERAGFDKPRLFMDGVLAIYPPFPSPSWNESDITRRSPRVHAFGNFWLGLLELWLRNPLADLFAMFQDDILLCKNVRQYVEATLPGIIAKHTTLEGFVPYYLNLFTCKPNESFVAKLGNGWHPSNQLGWGAQALVFPRDTVMKLFQSKHLVEKPIGMKKGQPQLRLGQKNIDGAICCSVKSFGGRELVHSQSLVYHVDGPSAIGNVLDKRMGQGTWPGEAWDCMSWLEALPN